jgi:subtilisin family serine protease
VKRLLLLASSLLAIAAAGAAAAPLRTPHAMRYAAGEVLVLVPDDAALDLDAGGGLVARDARLAPTLARLGLAHAERLGPAARGSSARLRLLRLTSARTDFDPVAAARELMASGAVRAACPDYAIPLNATTPNDSLLSLQWYVYHNTVRADIHLPEAWDLEKGSPATLIAILDTGVDTGHRDLASQIWTNPGEIPANGIDDDGNGLVDDVHGWDFGDGDNNPDPGFTPDASGIDVGFHGTFCAGLAAASTDNVSGIAGAGWKCSILPIKAAKADSGLSTSAVALGMAYAADMGAHVLSMSFGAANAPGVAGFFQALVDDDLAAGVICVAAAGNDGDSARVFPAACAGVISVGATDELDTRATFSNWGPWVKVAAPGSAMFSTISRNYELDFITEFIYELLFGYDGVNPYMYGDGTSFACPLVAGVCGLLHSHLPSLTPAGAEQLLIASGDAVAYDLPIGRKVNAWRALTQAVLAVEGAGVALPGPRLAAAPNPSAGATSLRFTLAAAGPARLTLYDCAGRRVRELVNGGLPAGRHEASWDGRGAGGERLPGGIYFARLDSGGRTVSVRVVRLGR